MIVESGSTARAHAFESGGIAAALQSQRPLQSQLMEERAMTAVVRSGHEEFTLIDRSVGDEFGESVLRGLTAPRKFLEPRFFYDALGSALFDAICQLPEYYITRCETELLRRFSRDIAGAFDAPVRLVEIGSGMARKTRFLLDPLASRPIEYIPIDIDARTLQECGRALLNEYRSLRITAIAADFRDPAGALEGLLPAGGRSVVLFLGSSIGNLDPKAAAAMLRDVRSLLSPGDLFLLGADLVKPKNILEPAYDDALGVTAAFNLNLLQRINRELGGDFCLSSWAHLSFFDNVESRIEMHLVSRERQRVHVDALGLEVEFAEGETIHTENSYKYEAASLERLAREGGFSIRQQWTDARGWFADILMVV